MTDGTSFPRLSGLQGAQGPGDAEQNVVSRPQTFWKMQVAGALQYTTRDIFLPRGFFIISTTWGKPPHFTERLLCAGHLRKNLAGPAGSFRCGALSWAVP